MQYRAKSIWITALLLCVSFASEALTLGSLRGSVIIGRPLDVTIPVQVEQADNAAASCFEVEVFHADVRQAAARVRLLVEPTGEPSSIQVRVLSSAPVNEPVVSVTLRTRCDLKTERRYILLADLPTGADLSAPAEIGVGSAATSSAALPIPANLALRSMAADAPLVKPKPEVRPKTNSASKAAKKPIAKAGERVSKRAAAPSGQSRLQLDNLELFSDRISLLDSEQPDVALDYVSPDQQKVLDLQSTVTSLKALAVKNEANLVDITTRLKQAEAERFPAWLVYVLAGLILVAVAAIAVLLRRQRRGQAQDGAWWAESVVTPDSTAPPVAGPIRTGPLSATPIHKPTGEPRLEKAVSSLPASQWPNSKNCDIDVNEVEMGMSRFNRYVQSDQAEKGPDGYSAAAPLDLIKPESERLDAAMIAELRQQAEFFVALGQTDQAVIVLEKLIRDSDVPDPNVFLDLLGLLHSLSKKVQFQRCREAFNLAFNGVISEFVRFKSEGRPLEDYPAALDDIVAHWASPDALECINSHLVRNPRQPHGASLDLAAFRDLLLLQGIAQQLTTEVEGPAGDAGVRHSGMAPWVEPQRVEPHEAELASMMALDLDLSFGDDEADFGLDAPESGSDGQMTFPTDLKPVQLTSTQVDNLIDFDLPATVKPSDPDRPS